MKLAAIDIGSNAIRLHIVKVFEENNLVSFKKLEYLRFPLRLGHDVFKKKMISIPTLDKFTKLMRTFKLLIDLYEVEGYNAVATSAMREAENGEEVRDYILNQTGVKIDIISGEDEARVLYKAILPYLQDSSHYIHIDVGGGSTELNFFEGKNLLKSKSFKIGSVRKLSREARAATFQEMKEWAQIPKDSKPKNIAGIGTGGNIGKLFKLSNKPKNQAMSLVELKGLAAYVREFTVAQRMSMLKMNPDRADVIIPASEIYIKVLQNVGSDQILVPKVGLKDGLVYELFEKISGKSIDQIEFLEDF